MAHSSGSSETRIQLDNGLDQVSPINDSNNHKTPAAGAARKAGEPTPYFTPAERTRSYFDTTNPEFKELRRQISNEIDRTTSAMPDPESEDFDLHEFLSKILDKHDASGVKRRTTGLVWADLVVEGVGSGADYGSSLSDLFTGITRIPQTIASIRHPPKKTILQGFSGDLRPGQMMLVLGRPGSGSSSLLKTLANYTDSFTSVQGFRTYDGVTPEIMEKRFGGELAYLPEDDIHFPLLTVGETLGFAAHARAPAVHARSEGMSRAGYTKTTVNVLLTLFGLRHVINTKVGNDYVRGVSGGERKRVSIAEVLTTRAKISCHDNSTRGLDSSTSLEYIRSLRVATDLSRTVTVASLYQCGEQLYDLFDKVCVIHSGRMIYFGPATQASAYFESLGYLPHDRQTTADFLVSVTDERARLISKDVPNVPKTADELATAFKQSEIYTSERKLIEDAKAGFSDERNNDFKASAKQEKMKHVRGQSSYNISYKAQLGLAIRRRWQLLLGDFATTMIQAFVFIFQALIIGSTFYSIPRTTQGFFSRGGVIFFAILFSSLTSMAEIPSCFAQRPILVRQRRYRMARPSADALAQTIVDLVPKAIIQICFVVVLYWMTGLNPGAARFFIFFLFVFVTACMMATYFRALAAICRSQAVATMLGGISVLLFLVTVGYAIPRPGMLGWYRWFSESINPIAFSFEALYANELLAQNVPCAQLVPSGAGYAGITLANQVCPTPGYDRTTGLVNAEIYLSTSYGYSYSHVWRNFGIILGFYFGFLAIQLIGTEFQRDEAAAAAVVLFKRSNAPKAIEEQVNATGKAIDLEKSNSETTEVPSTAEADKQADAAAEDIIAKPTAVFTWRNLHYDVAVKGGQRRLLSNVTGYAKPGALTALMGESGAGKTTLLNVLAQRAGTGVISGDMLVNGQPLPKSFAKNCGYAQQQDVHLQTSTVREALQFSALLRQSASTPKAEKLAYVEEVIKLLEMEAYAEALVGEVGSGLSVEQRKRLTVGVELAAKPTLLLFLDEPTSGLDSISAFNIVQLLRKLADHGQAILCTIHQPSGELLSHFDRLLLLKKGGKTVYFGNLGKGSRTMIDYFSRQSGEKCPERANPAEWMLEQIGAGATAKTSYDWAQLWNESPEAQTAKDEVEQLHQEYTGNHSDEDDAEANKTYSASFATQLAVVTRRSFQSYWRDTTYIASKIGLNVISSLWIGFTFFKANDSTSGLQIKLFGVFMAIVVSTSLAQQLQPRFIEARALYEVREQPSRMYSWVISALVPLLTETPFNLFGGALYFAIWAPSVALYNGRPRDAFYAFAIYELFTIYWSSFAMAVASFASNGEIASILFSTLFSFTLIFCGVLQPTALMPHFWAAWMPKVATFTYIVDSLLSSAIGNGQRIVCTDEQFSIVSPPGGQSCSAFLDPFIAANTGYVDNPNDTADCRYCQYAYGDEYLRTVGYSYSHRARNVGILFIYIFFNIFALFFLYYFLRVRGKAAGAAKHVKEVPHIEGADDNSSKQSEKPAEKQQ
ncbi:uncharacterized protein L969DRAFT_87260 [Mixia osmundae IAM 14324]|uniref:ABC transporter domain-containing protein n=1 Tax=Mixia osmundae (strain CBS 9802 / IAM 14324 / JCM 22182 / KY 12970) TaxID=764103 RepID=G7E3B5_MIXOS|nr:uncharacterized protein L969DRAFT_87260 [Mixia osmundae IAM 14324]KEI39312.1 hypothetical protein L969DRAFT_87260 [Mixia osmundae IAM 14324]GAA97325.1 hypothetical protein E5Q_04003 [Mixia osmundae IAM 14324]